MPEFVLTAEDQCVPLDVLEFVALAVDLQMRRDVRRYYDAEEIWTVGAMPSLDGLRDAPDVRKVLTFRRKLDVPGALGFHTQSLGVEYAESLPPPINGGIIDGTTVSHEVIETFVDPGCDQSWLMPDGSRVDFEAADPVEADGYSVSVTLGHETRIVVVSNFVTPAWFQIPGTEAETKFDFLGKLRAPFTMSPGGYYRRVDIDGSDELVFADAAARARVQAKLANPTSRVARRAR